MKLYTEEQVKQIIANYNTERFVSTDELLEDLKLTPITIPSDEEIEEECRKLPYEKHLDDGQYNDGQMAGFELGAYWVRQQILNQN